MNVGNTLQGWLMTGYANEHMVWAFYFLGKADFQLRWKFIPSLYFSYRKTIRNKRSLYITFLR